MHFCICRYCLFCLFDNFFLDHPLSISICNKLFSCNLAVFEYSEVVLVDLWKPLLFNVRSAIYSTIKLFLIELSQNLCHNIFTSLLLKHFYLLFECFKLTLTTNHFDANLIN